MRKFILAVSITSFIYYPVVATAGNPLKSIIKGENPLKVIEQEVVKPTVEVVENKTRQTVEGAAEIVGQAGKDLGNGLDATVGKGLKETGRVLDETVAPVIKEVGGAVTGVMDSTLTETQKTLKKADREVLSKVGEVLDDTARYVKENPGEALLIAIAIYGGYLVIIGEYTLTLNLVGVPVLFYDGSEEDKRSPDKRPEPNSTESPNNPGAPDSKKPESDPVQDQLANLDGYFETLTNTYKFYNVPVIPTGDKVPDRSMNDMEKIIYAMEVIDFSKRYPSSMYQNGQLTLDLALQESKLLEAKILLETVLPSSADLRVDDRDEENAFQNIVMEGVKQLLKGNPSKASREMMKELAEYAAGPSVLADGTLRGKASVMRLHEELSQDLQEYNKIRFPEPPVSLSEWQLQEAKNDNNGSVPKIEPMQKLN